MPNNSLKMLLETGAYALNLTLSASQIDQLLQYAALLAKWSQVYNLTAIREPEAIVREHLLDSLAVTSLVKGPQILDVGSGAGLPGIPLAIALSAYHFVLLDSALKRTRFLSQVVSELGLSNASVVNGRIETYQSPCFFDTITARALATVTEIVQKTLPFCADEGQWLLLKGQDPQVECENLPKTTAVLTITPLTVPGLQKARHAVRIINQRK
ncbi:MAG: rRNA small subunit methyltransferase GidB [Gammaproteobacteria bacterium]|nr:rRNA small subunit methyltransferase GidB [Gammaproteobacteria bacterium]